MTKFNYHLHYSDGLTKHLVINFDELEETWPVWLSEIEDGQLEYVKVRVIKEPLTNSTGGSSND